MNRWMQAALEEAEKGIESGDGGPFGAVIVKEGKIVARGHNEVVARNDPTAHAEMLAIRRAARELKNFSLEGCELYTTGEPCPMCFSAIHWAHLDRVVYCNTKEEAAEIGFDDSLITEIILGKISDPIHFSHNPDAACKSLIGKWYDDPKKVPY